ncbi:MAG: 50S ribosomal protein L9 [Bacteroidota bacterium]
MEIILKEDVKGLGYKNDIVDVRPGYGRNYLIPQGFALQATPGSKKQVAENLRQAAHKADKIRNDAQALAESIGDITLTVKAKAGESGKIFGAVTTLQLADALKAAGHDVERKRISINGDVKHLGEYTAELNLHKEVHHTVKFNVVAD